MRYIVKSYITDQHGNIMGRAQTRTYTLEELCEIYHFSSYWIQQQGVGLIMNEEHPFGGWLKIIAIPQYVEVVQ